MNFDKMKNPTGTINSMTSTFSLLMKIVRDLALNRDDPEGREHNKHFVEQQFINSDVRIERVINECGTDLTNIIQIFDLIMRRVERSRREASACLFSVRNCKQMFLLRRAECRRLWFQSIEQKSLVKIYDQLIELKKVKSRCQTYVINGYLIHAAHTIEQAMKLFNRDIKQLKHQRIDNDTDVQSNTIPSERRLLRSISNDWTTQTKAYDSLLVNSKNINNDCFSHLRNEIIETAEDLLKSLMLAMELCLFGIHIPELYGREKLYGIIVSEWTYMNVWSPELSLFWKEKHSRDNFFATENDDGGYNYDFGYETALEQERIKSKNNTYLPDPLSFEIDRSDLADKLSLHNISGSREVYIQYIFECANQLTLIPDCVSRLIRHLINVLPERLDRIAVAEVALMKSNISANLDIASDHSQINSEPIQSGNLSVLMGKMFEHYEQIAELCKPLIHTYIDNSHSKDKEELSKETLYEYSSMYDDINLSDSASYVWLVVQRPLAAVLLAHLINDMENDAINQNLSLIRRDLHIPSTSVCDFNSDLVLEVGFKINRTNPAQRLRTDERTELLANTDDLSHQGVIVDNLSIDLDQFFFDSNTMGITNVVGSPRTQAPSHKTVNSNEIAYSRKMTIYSNEHHKSRISNLEGKLFRFDRSAQVQSLSEYYKDVGDQAQNVANASVTEGATLEDKFSKTNDGTLNILGIKSILVCTPSYRNVHGVYSKLSQICMILDKKIKSDDTIHHEDRPHHDYMHNKQKVHLTLLKDVVREFVRDTFVIKLRSDVRRKITESLPVQSRLTELLPESMDTDNGQMTQHKNPILVYSFLSIQAIDELLTALYDMLTYTREFWIAINEIVLQHRAGTTNIFSNTLMKSPLSVEWVRDVDVNRHLRSMPSLQQLLISGRQKVLNTSKQLPRLNTITMDSRSSRRKSIMLTAGKDTSSDLHSIAVKEAESILANLIKEELFSSERMITDYRQIRQTAHQHESMIWFVNEFHKSVRKKKDKININNIGDNELPENESVMANVQQTEHIAEDILLIIFVEIRVHCFYHLLALSNPNNLLEYATRPSAYNVFPNVVDQNNLSVIFTDVNYKSDSKSFYSTEDYHVQSLCRDLVRLQECLIGALPMEKIDFIFEGLGYIIATIFIELVDKLSILDDVGLLKMRQNILSIHKCLISLYNQRNQKMNNGSMAWINKKVDNQSFDESYDIRNLLFQKHGFSDTKSDRQEMLRALHFYDLLTSSNVDNLIKRIQQESKRSQYREQDYYSLVSLKFRIDRSRADNQTINSETELENVISKVRTALNKYNPTSSAI